MKERKITVEFRPEQLADVVDGLRTASNCEREDAEILGSMDRVDRQSVADTVARQDTYARLSAWLQHVLEEAE